MVHCFHSVFLGAECEVPTISNEVLVEDKVCDDNVKNDMENIEPCHHQVVISWNQNEVNDCIWR